MREYSRVEPINLSKRQIFTLAESIASDLGFEPGENIHEVVENLGGEILVENLLLEDPAQCGTLYVDGPEDFRIVVPSHTSSVRDRFTIAHELGHFFLHYLLANDEDDLVGKKIIAYRKDSERVEWEANWFAAAFLMPEELFKEKFRATKDDLSRVADFFSVSHAAARVRAKDLGLILE
jgi:Zn-dependent peptidase ImmA (M78 family)